MAREHGIAGNTLRGRLFFLIGFLLLVGVGVSIVLWLSSPGFAVAAPVAGGVAVLALLKDKSIQQNFRRIGKGYLGERAAGKALLDLPTGWRVFHDVQLEGENADHVVVSSRGVFSVEVKNYSGRVIATPNGLFTHGQRNDRIVQQAWRQAHTLRELLGVEVEPLLVFAGGSLKGRHVGNLRLLTVGELVPYLTSLTDRKLEYEDARRLFEILDAKTFMVNEPLKLPESWQKFGP